MGRPGPPGPPRPPGPPPSGPPPPGPPPAGPPPAGPPSGGPPPPKPAGGGGDDGRNALMAAIRGGAALKKTAGPPEKAGPGNVVGAEKPRAQPQAPQPSRPQPSRGGLGGMDFAAELNNRINNRQNKITPKVSHFQVTHSNFE